MAILVKPYLGCNENCLYCYENNCRGKLPSFDYDIDRVLASLENVYKAHPREIVLHGGEPLCMPISDVEAILKKSYELSQRSGIQTNGTLLSYEHVKLFKKYNTHIGISLDGPGKLSEFRLPETEADEMCGRIRFLRQEGLPVSVIVVISRANAGDDERLESLKAWLKELDEIGVHGRLNPCASEPKYDLDTERMKDVYLSLAMFLMNEGIEWNPFPDISRRLLGESATCTFMGCDPFFTPSATVILNDGSISNCMRTNSDDLLLRPEGPMNIRGEILQDVPQEFGGCRDCRFWPACQGGCPAMTVDGDWRSRTVLCPMYKALFEYVERIHRSLGIVPRAQPAPPGFKHTDTHQDRGGRK